MPRLGLIFNIHVSGEPGDSITFPASESGLPDEFARLVFRVPSELPPYLQKAAAAEEYSLQRGSRGFLLQADAADVIQFLEIGSRPDELEDDVALGPSDELDVAEDDGALEGRIRVYDLRLRFATLSWMATPGRRRRALELSDAICRPRILATRRG